MIQYIYEAEKLRHPFYKIMEMKSVNLQTKLDTWTREQLIEWLSWNDRNGVYKDEESMKEFGNVLNRKEAIDIIIKQIAQV